MLYVQNATVWPLTIESEYSRLLANKLAKMVEFNIETTGEQIVAEFGANAEGKTCK